MQDVLDTNITQVIEALAGTQPEAPAIHVPGRPTLKYRELGQHIRYVRKRMGDWGILPGDVVAAAIPSRPVMAVAIATLPASCTLGPLDPFLPTEVYASLLKRMGAKAVLVTSGQEHSLRSAARILGIAEIDVAAERDAAAGLFSLSLNRGDPARSGGNSSDPRNAYILTSSGTTGRPKLVPLEHRTAQHYARAIYDWLDFTPADVGVHLTPEYLGNGLSSGLLNALMGGRSLALLPVADIDALFAAVEEYRPTFLIANVSIFKEVLRRAPEFRVEIAQSRFRFLRWAGRVDLDDADRLEQLFGAPMLTGLSSTETSRISHDPLPPRIRKRGSVGLPMVNDVALLDGFGNVVRHGGPGEILVRGPMVFRGYLDDPELTAASFLGDWFRTGDLGRIDEDGYVYFLGRIKEIINRGGEKISPVEIDLAIESLPGVKEAAAFAIPHQTLGEEIVAAVVREENSGIDERAVVERVRARTGPRKVPRRVYFVERLPRTDNGKLRRSALPDLLSPDQVVSARGQTPTAGERVSLSPLEGALAGLWASLLNVDSVKRDDDFFLLGGDSLRGTQLIAHLRTIFGVDLALLSLFGSASTVAGMARAVEIARAGERSGDQELHGETDSVNAAIRPRRDRGSAALAHTQLRMWLLARLDPDNRAYNVAEAHRVLGPIDVEAVRMSLLAFVQRHEILRTTFVLVGDEPRQFVQATAALDFEYLDFTETPSDAREHALLRLIDSEEQRRFDFERGPAVRFRLIRFADDDHVLLRVWHHIVWDGWSMSVADRDMSQLYAAFASGRDPQLPALPIQYADYAEWQRQRLESESLQRQLAYWKARLAGAATLELPADRPRPPVFSSRGSRSVFHMEAPLTQDLKEVGRQEGATLFMTLLAAFQVLLARYSGSEDIVVGTPIAGRGRTELEGLVGFFANTLVLRSDLSGNPRFCDLLASVRENALAAYAHQDLPFEKLVEDLAPARDLSRNPLFQVLFALQNNPPATLELEGAQVSRVALPRRNVKFDISLAVRESSEGLRTSWEYSSDLFDAATIARMAGHYQVVLEAVVADPSTRIGDLPLLTELERRQLQAWNDTATDYPSDRCVHQLFESQAARMPEAVAVVCEGDHLTYAELNARANQLAHHLIALGVQPEELVSLCLDRSLDMIIGLLGILKAGGAYVPLDPSNPPARLAFVFSDTAAPVLVTRQALVAALPPFNGHVLCVDRDAVAIAAQSSTNPSGTATANTLAYVMYTSGSTGAPKGVAVGHRGIARLVCNTDYVTIDSADCVAQISNTAFDAATFEIWGALVNGASLAIIPRDVTLNAPRLVEELRHRRVSIMFLTTALFNEVVRHHADAFAGVKQLFFGGEAVDPHWVGECLRAGAPQRLLHVYGPTECTTFSTCYLVETVAPDARTISIGKPIANTVLYVLDQYLRPVPVGVPGELYVGGDGLARGYWNRPRLTPESFVPDPFSGVPAARMYRTGDRVRYLVDGNLEFLGRLDHQVKIRGFRIELGEIETVLARHPAVRHAAVLARQDMHVDTQLVAYLVLADPTATDIELLRAHLRTYLPDYMHPATFVVLDELPRTPTGKLDRHALPAPHFVRERTGETSPPRNAFEELIAEVWREVLRVERIGVHDNFFEVGGHSLLATQIVTRLSKLMQMEVPLRVMFEAPTIAQLAMDLVRLDGGSAERTLERILREMEARADEETA